MTPKYITTCPTCGATFLYEPREVNGELKAICPLCDAPSGHRKIKTVPELEQQEKKGETK